MKNRDNLPSENGEFFSVELDTEKFNDNQVISIITLEHSVSKESVALPEVFYNQYISEGFSNSEIFKIELRNQKLGDILGSK